MSKTGTHSFLFFVLTIIPFVSSCKERLIKNELSSKNPIEYIFSVPKSTIRELILSKKFNMLAGYWVLDTAHAMLGNYQIKNLLKKQCNFSDIYLMPSGPSEKSKIYLLSSHDSVEYVAWYYLHIEEIDAERTKISILTFDPKIVAGYEVLPTPPHFGRSAIWVTVEPTTVEEYKLLLIIGSIVHEKNMPPIILPDGNHWNSIKLKRD